jgi:hypothetical protein
MINKDSSTGYIEDLVDAIRECIAVVNHLEKYLERADLSDYKKGQAKVLKNNYLSLRRQLMGALKEIAGDDFDTHSWCEIKHSLAAGGLLREVAQADEMFESYASWAHKLELQTLALATGVPWEDCMTCLSDQLRAKLERTDGTGQSD